jgi:hypothetical protein
MELQVCRFRGDRALTEGIFTIVFCFVTTCPVARFLHFRLADWPEFLIPGAVLTTVALTLLIWRRWRSRIVLDDRGVEWRRSRRGVVTRLEWSEVDEFFLMGGIGFELRGAGRRISFTELYEDIYNARDLSLPRLSGMRDLLRTRALQDGRIVFRMPGGRWKAHVAYLGAVLILTGITWYCLATLLDRTIRGFPFIILVFGGSWLWGLRRRASGMGTRVTLQREGLTVRRLDGKDRIAWEDLERTQCNANGGLDLVLRSKRVIALPSALANIGLLEEFIHEGSAAVELEARGGAGNRTMIQSP